MNPVSQAVTNMVNLKIARETNEANKQIHREDNAFNERMWNLNNEYNTPTAHMQRLLDAGINPMYDSAYGGDTSSTVTAASPIAMQAPTLNPVQFNLSDAELKQAQIDNINADTEKKGAETEHTRALTENENQMREGRVSDLYAGIDLKVSTKNLTDSQIKESAERIENLKKERAKLQSEIDSNMNSIDISQREQVLNEASFEFSKLMQEKQLSLQEKALAINEFNAMTERYAQQSRSALESAQTVAQDQENAINKPEADFAKSNSKSILGLLCRGFNITSEQYKRTLKELRQGYDKPEWFQNSLEYAGDVIGTIGRAFGSAGAGVNVLNGWKRYRTPVGSQVTP